MFFNDRNIKFISENDCFHHYFFFDNLGIQLCFINPSHKCLDNRQNTTLQKQNLFTDFLSLESFRDSENEFQIHLIWNDICHWLIETHLNPNLCSFSHQLQL